MSQPQPGPSLLVPLDGSKAAENAIPVAAALRAVHNGRIDFLNVQSDDNGTEAEKLQAQRNFADYLRSRVTDFGIPEDQFTARVAFGSPAPTILDASKGASGIVIASHGRGGFRATVMGSVADRVIRGAEVPVLVVPGVGGPPVRIEKVLVPLDGSKTSESALGHARALAAALKAKLYLLHAFTIIPPFASADVYLSQDTVNQIIEGAKAYIASVALPGEEALVDQGDAANSIVATAAERDIDLVVMTSRGKGGAKRLFLGGTAEGVIHRLHRPLLIIPATD